ncbi:MAG: long-chain fatty acid--CoA ligase [Rickettsiales bacterium]|nr:long-chain fatty acid--CoA ligase [Rickettsiales bacterium]
MSDFSTLSQLICFQASKFNNPKALNFKDNNFWRSFSNQDFLENIFYFACGLKEIGIEKNHSLAICSYQNPIWLIADLGAILAGAVTVPIFSNIAFENLSYQISDAEVKYFFTDNVEVFTKVKNLHPEVKLIVYGFSAEGAIDFEGLILLGKNAAMAKKYLLQDFERESKPQDLVTIIYTSGSTGKPKGVELTNCNLVSQIHDTAIFFPLKNQDVALSFLPLAHIFERMVMLFYITQGISVYFVNDVKNVGIFLQEIHPTLMTTVPRVMEKVFVKIKDGIDLASFFKKIIGKKALKRALTKNPQHAKNIIDKIFDLIIYKKFRAALGGNIRMIICGGASLSPDLERFYVNIGIKLFCGYGMTETSPVLAANSPTSYKFSTVGKAFPSVKLKIAADGELLANGPNIMRGYHQQPQKTAETILDGWLKTGDLAEIDQEGFVKIIGRKKEVFKNANGKYVCPVVLEQKLIQNLEFLLGAIIIGEGRKFTSALLFPDFEVLKKFKNKLKFNSSDAEFLTSEILQNFVQKNIAIINNHLDHWEQIQKFYIVPKPISIESGEITPSMKLKRNILQERYKNIIEDFYKEHTKLSIF